MQLQQVGLDTDQRANDVMDHFNTEEGDASEDHNSIAMDFDVVDTDKSSVINDDGGSFHSTNIDGETVSDIIVDEGGTIQSSTSNEPVGGSNNNNNNSEDDTESINTNKSKSSIEDYVGQSVRVEHLFESAGKQIRKVVYGKIVATIHMK